MALTCAHKTNYVRVIRAHRSSPASARLRRGQELMSVLLSDWARKYTTSKVNIDSRFEEVMLVARGDQL